MTKNEKPKDFGDELYELMKKHKVSMESANEMIGTVMKSLSKPIENALKAELDMHLGYDKNNKASGENYRNGYSEKTVKSTFGEATLKIPRDREGSFEPQIVKKHQRDISELERKVIFMYAKGISNRDISETIKEIYGIDLDATYISKITDQIMPDIEEFRTRSLDKVYPIVFIDGIRFKTREEGYAKEVSVYIAMGITLDGRKEVLGFYIGESESSKYWLSVFSDLKNRGIEQILIMACDNLPGISNAVAAAFPKSIVQKCVVHQIRNSVKFVNYKDLKAFTVDMKKIYEAPNLESSKYALEEFGKKWSGKYGYAVKSWQENFSELTSFFNFPQEIRKLIYTTNPIENLNRCIRKNTKNKTSFPSEKSLIKSIYLSIMEVSKKWTASYRDWGAVINQLSIIFKLEI